MTLQEAYYQIQELLQEAPHNANKKLAICLPDATILELGDTFNTDDDDYIQIAAIIPHDQRG